MTAPTVASLKAELDIAKARISDLERALGQGDDNLGIAFNLAPCLSNLLGCLLATPNVTVEMITLRLGIATEAKVAIHRLRGVLKDRGLVRPDRTSVIQSKRGLGYWLDPSDKERIRVITRGVTEHVAMAPESIEAPEVIAA